MELEIIPNRDVNLIYDINHNKLTRDNTHYVIVTNEFTNQIHIRTFQIKIYSTITSLDKIMLNDNLACIRFRKTKVGRNMINCNKLNNTKLVVTYDRTK